MAVNGAASVGRRRRSVSQMGRQDASWMGELTLLNVCAKRSRFVFPACCLVLVLRSRAFTHRSCDTPGCWFVVGCFGVFPVVLCRAVAFASRFPRVFDTPVDALFSNGSRDVHEGPGCVDRRCAVGLSLAARHGGLAPGDWGGLLVWWWFENSRAYLYYFFIVNDCQSVLRPARVWRVGAGRPVKRDGVFADSPFSL